MVFAAHRSLDLQIASAVQIGVFEKLCVLLGSQHLFQFGKIFRLSGTAVNTGSGIAPVLSVTAILAKSLELGGARLIELDKLSLLCVGQAETFELSQAAGLAAGFASRFVTVLTAGRFCAQRFGTVATVILVLSGHAEESKSRNGQNHQFLFHHLII